MSHLHSWRTVQIHNAARLHCANRRLITALGILAHHIAGSNARSVLRHNLACACVLQPIFQRVTPASLAYCPDTQLSTACIVLTGGFGEALCHIILCCGVPVQPCYEGGCKMKGAEQYCTCDRDLTFCRRPQEAIVATKRSSQQGIASMNIRSEG